ncbi:hypothetical protein [Plantactinospora sp. CA-290183]|uniref:hypothetical protein n=1 Tax=Plantactinospora sp. CA-290183 TaxID=3240006 RepID=UPI003D8D53E5
MSDFDVVLERLLTDPLFAAALAGDPDGALAGYQLEADEQDLLRLQVGVDPGARESDADRTNVEGRTNQSSLSGMFTPLVGALGGLTLSRDVVKPALPTGGFGAAAPAGALGAAVPVEGFGAAVPVDGVGAPAAPLGDCAPAAVPLGGPGQPGAGLAAGGLAGLGDEIGESIRTATDAAAVAADGGLAGALAGAEVGGGSPGPAAEVVPPLPEGYRTRVDVDGDGDWDRHTLHGRADGGVDIQVDLDRDGRADFVGHDLDGDRLVDVSEYDEDGDGFFERRMHDEDGDGWMDRTVRVDPPPA